jgi:hypothetical protein
MTIEEGLEEILQTLFKQICNDLEFKQCWLPSLLSGRLFLFVLPSLSSIALKSYPAALPVEPVLHTPVFSMPPPFAFDRCGLPALESGLSLLNKCLGTLFVVFRCLAKGEG